jgi:hypothetical protein
MSSEQKATRQIIAIGNIEVEGFMLPDGSYRMSQTQAAECVGLEERNARDFLQTNALKRLLGDGYTPAISQTSPIEIEAPEGQARGGSRIVPLPLEIVSAYWLWQSHRGNKTALSFCLALVTESLERRFDGAFGVARSTSEYNQRLADRTLQLETALQQIGDGLAFDDDLRMERDRFRQLLEENGIDPYGIPEGTDG